MAAGYVYAIMDPRLEEPNNIVFVGVGERPWESIERHLKRSSNPRVAAWASSMSEAFPEGIEILGRVVADRYHGDPIEIPPPTPGRTRLEWKILDIEIEVERDETENIIRVSPARKSYWIERLLGEGQPLLNLPVGRPRTKTERSIPTVYQRLL